MGGKSTKLTPEELSDLVANQNIRCKITVSQILSSEYNFLVNESEIKDLWNGWEYDIGQHRLPKKNNGEKEKGLPKPAFIKNFSKVEICT